MGHSKDALTAVFINGKCSACVGWGAWNPNAGRPGNLSPRAVLTVQLGTSFAVELLWETNRPLLRELGGRI